MSRLRLVSLPGSSGAILGMSGGGGAALKTDPSQLPAATTPGQTPSGVSTYGRTLNAGQTYADPLSGVTVLKLTDSTHPAANAGMRHGYATSGPRISQPWTSAGKRWYTIAIDADEYLVDVCWDDLTITNWRVFTQGSDTRVAFSLDPATPRIMYAIDSANKRINRWDTSPTGVPTLANTGHWPWNIAATGTTVNWINTQIGDAYVSCQVESSKIIVCFIVATGVEIACSQVRSGVALDEHHMDLRDPIIYISQNTADNKSNMPWRLDTDTLNTTPNVGNDADQDDHVAPGYGFVVGTANVVTGTGGAFLYRGLADTNAHIVTTINGYHGGNNDSYTNSDWCIELRGAGAEADTWHTTDRFINDDTGAKIRKGMMAWVKNDGSEVRILGAHDSTTPGYDQYPKLRMSPDGRFAMWTSDMNGTARTDIFIAKMPVS